MNTKHKLTGVALTALLAMSTSVLAQSHSFADVDVDSDGQITLEEGMKVHTDWNEQAYKQLDTDGDGFLSENEYAAVVATTGAEPGMAKSSDFATIDIDQDGKVSFEEGRKVHTDWTEEAFKELDTDQDGMLNDQEYAVAVGAHQSTTTISKSSSEMTTESTNEPTQNAQSSEGTSQQMTASAEAGKEGKYKVMRHNGPARYVEAGDQSDILASTLIGMRIYAVETDIDESRLYPANARTDWEDIGEVNDVVLDWDGNIKAVVLGVGGFLGLGEKDVAIDISSLRRVKERDDAGDWFLVVNSSKTSLEQAPTYRR